MVGHPSCFAVSSLSDVYQHLYHGIDASYIPKKNIDQIQISSDDMRDIVGQEQAKRALLIAAAGQHHILFCGPPGTGKTMLASRLLSILPPLSEQEALDVATIRSVANQSTDPEYFFQRPFRNPHHTCSAAVLVGDGGIPKPGEVTLAHHGVLFLDELTEFPRKVLDVLREPLESGVVSISRAAKQALFPARFQLVAALNPSPSGDIQDGRCNHEQILRYLNRVSGPLLERIDLQVDVPKLSAQELILLRKQKHGTSSQYFRDTVAQAREIQLARAGKLNADLTPKELQELCSLSDELADFLESAVAQLKLSMRSMHRIMRVARTIADLDGVSQIRRQDLAEAMGYRALERIIASLQNS